MPIKKPKGASSNYLFCLANSPKPQYIQFATGLEEQKQQRNKTIKCLSFCSEKD